MYSIDGVVYRFDTETLTLVKAVKTKPSPGQLSLFDAPPSSDSDEAQKHPHGSDGKFTSKGQGVTPKKEVGDRAEMATQIVSNHLTSNAKDLYGAEGARNGKISPKQAEYEGVDHRHPGSAWDEDFYNQHLDQYRKNPAQFGEHLKQKHTVDDAEDAFYLGNKLARLSLNAVNHDQLADHINNRAQGKESNVKGDTPETQAVMDHIDRTLDVDDPDVDEEDKAEARQQLQNEVAKHGVQKWVKRQLNPNSYSFSEGLHDDLSQLGGAHVDWEKVGQHVASTLRLPQALEYENSGGKLTVKPWEESPQGQVQKAYQKGIDATFYDHSTPAQQLHAIDEAHRVATSFPDMPANEKRKLLGRVHAIANKANVSDSVKQRAQQVLSHHNYSSDAN